jgi:hypothetical protein
MMAPVEQFATVDDRIAELWRQRFNTYEIAKVLTHELREPIEEHHVYRVIARREPKGGAK